jgi:hypothetical protein
MTVTKQISIITPDVSVPVKNGLFHFGKLESTSNKIIYPVQEINYNVGGCPVLWLNVSNMKEAREYYDNRFNCFPKSVRDSLAEYSLINKITIAKKNKNI